MNNYCESFHVKILRGWRLLLLHSLLLAICFTVDRHWLVLSKQTLTTSQRKWQVRWADIRGKECMTSLRRSAWEAVAFSELLQFLTDACIDQRAGICIAMYWRLPSALTGCKWSTGWALFIYELMLKRPFILCQLCSSYKWKLFICCNLYSTPFTP